MGQAKTSDGTYHAVISDNGDPWVDLNTLISPDPGWELLAAGGINESGTIVGWGINPSGDTEAWIATVPEPSTLALLAMGGFGLLAYSWRRRTA